MTQLLKFEGSKIDIETFRFGLSQIINKSTHFLHNTLSGIDLIFTAQPNSVMHSGVDPSLDPNCHYQIVFQS